jgi:FkbM family methyltransferase
MTAPTIGRLAGAARRRLVPRAMFFDMAARFTPAVAVEVAGLRYWVSTSDRFVGRETFLTGGFDDGAMERILAALEHHGPGFSLAGRTVLDIGANIGTTTVPLLRRFGARRAIAIEPVPANGRLLAMNCLDNGVLDRVAIHAVALSDRDGEVTMALSSTNSGDHRVLVAGEQGGVLGEAARRTVTVPALRLDTMVARGTVDLDELGLVWMDAQGHEGAILSGARSLLGGPAPIVTELWPYGLRRHGGLRAMCELLAAHYDAVVEMGAPEWPMAPVIVPTTELAALVARYDGVSFTDLLLVPAYAKAGRS